MPAQVSTTELRAQPVSRAQAAATHHSILHDAHTHSILHWPECFTCFCGSAHAHHANACVLALSTPNFLHAAPPRVWGYRQCMEIDSQFFWSGAPWDMVARAYVADTLNKGLQATSYGQTNVIAVSAMEAIGVSSECSGSGKLGQQQTLQRGAVPALCERLRK